uniref:Uncharacterized protein n=1 Tax=Opuntia streptacantha TaxID=393608 RepID=A0A7C8YZ11_OPUST
MFVNTICSPLYSKTSLSVAPLFPNRASYGACFTAPKLVIEEDADVELVSMPSFCRMISISLTTVLIVGRSAAVSFRHFMASSRNFPKPYKLGRFFKVGSIISVKPQNSSSFLFIDVLTSWTMYLPISTGCAAVMSSSMSTPKLYTSLFSLNSWVL